MAHILEYTERCEEKPLIIIESTHRHPEILIQKDIESQVHTEINKERNDCLAYGYCQNLCTEEDVIDLIDSYYGSSDNIEVGRFITVNQYFDDWSIHLAVRDHDHKFNVCQLTDWPKYLYVSETNNIIGFILTYSLYTILVAAGWLSMLVLLILQDMWTLLIVSVVTISVTLFVYFMIKVDGLIPWIKQKEYKNIYFHSLLKFNIEANMVQEWKLKLCKFKSYGNLSFREPQYFCKIEKMRDIVCIDQLKSMYMYKPFVSTSNDGKRYRVGGFLLFGTGDYFELQYGVDCIAIQKKLDKIMQTQNQSFCCYEIKEKEAYWKYCKQRKADIRSLNCFNSSR